MTMKDTKRLLQVKARLKKRQPRFIRQDAHKRSMNEGWRSAKGLHSKMGDNRRGYRKPLKGGYRTPTAVRGLDRNGLRPARVETLAQLAKLDPKTHSVIIGGALGGRKRLAIIEAAQAKGFSLTNATAATAARIKESYAAKAKAKKERVTQAKTVEKVAEAKSVKEAGA